MEKLDRIVKITGVGIPNLMATCIERNDFKAMYLRDDRIYEIFYIKKAKAATIFGKDYLDREVYPSNEDFGFIGSCTHDKERAYEIYNGLQERQLDSQDTEDTEEND